ncbi:MAG: hypothetical protein ACRENL_05700 [Candidatus Dormibacteria bacterium]
MIWLLAYGAVTAASTIILGWLLHSAPIFDESERPVASWATAAAFRGGMWMRPHAPAGSGRASTGPLLRSSAQSPSRPRSFRLTRDVPSFRLAR